MIQPLRLPSLCLALLPLLSATPLAVAQDRSPPDLVVILCDDLGQGDPGCYNPDSRIPTPHIDRLAAEGLRFSDAHTPSAVCTPTRYGLLTGRYAWRGELKSGVLWNGWARALIEEDRPTLASLLQQRGAVCAAVGKWHLGWDWASTDGSTIDAGHHPAEAVDYAAPVTRGPASLGFERCQLIPASLDMPPYLWLVDGRTQQAPTAATPGSARRWSGGGGFWRAGPRAPGFAFDDVLPAATEAAVSFLERRAAARRAGDERPFFLYLPLPAPHTPWMPTSEWQGRTPVGWYGDFVAQTDGAVGRVLAALDRNGLSDDTLVVFTSDNGSHWPAAQIEAFQHDAHNGRRGQKADIWEGGHRVPLIVRWPGVVAAGTETDQLACLTDLYATVAEILGHDLGTDEAEDSVSLLPVLEGRARAPVRESLVHHSLDGTFALRRGRWKLVADNLGSGGFTGPKVLRPGSEEAPDGVGGQLYDLAADPAEQHNLWSEQPEVAAALLAELEALRAADRSR